MKTLTVGPDGETLRVFEDARTGETFVDESCWRPPGSRPVRFPGDAPDFPPKPAARPPMSYSRWLELHPGVGRMRAAERIERYRADVAA